MIVPVSPVARTRPSLIASAVTNDCLASCVAIRPLTRRRSAGVPAREGLSLVIGLKARVIYSRIIGKFYDRILSDAASRGGIENVRVRGSGRKGQSVAGAQIRPSVRDDRQGDVREPDHELRC